MAKIVKSSSSNVNIDIVTDQSDANVFIKQSNYNYNKLSNLPEINGKTVIGSHNGEYYGLVDAEEGKTLSENDFTNELKEKLDGIENNAQVNVKSNWNEEDDTSDAFILNKPTNISSFNNDAGYFNEDNVNASIATHNIDENAHEDIRNLISGADNKIDEVKTELEGKIADESSARTSADNTLQQNINNESSTRTSADNTLNTKIDNTKTELESTINTKVNEEKQRATQAESILQTNIDNESSTRQESDNTLQTNINNLSNSLNGRISSVETNLNSEITSRTNADNSLSSRITTTTNNLTDEIARAKAAELDIKNNYVPKTRTINGKELSSNITLRASDVGALPSSTTIGNGTITISENNEAIDSFKLNQTTNKTINISVPVKTSDLINDGNGPRDDNKPFTTEPQVQQIVYASITERFGDLNKRIDDEIIDRENADTTLGRRIDDEEARAKSVEGTLSNLTTDAKSNLVSAINEVDAHADSNATNISNIQELIPNTATSENQLADKAFVNSSIATNTANFIGTFNSVEELEAYSGLLTNNDYAFVIGVDADNNTVYDRYKYTTATTPPEWVYEYTLNNSSFTANQWAAINSGATQESIAKAESALQENDNVSLLTNDAGYVNLSQVKDAYVSGDYIRFDESVQYDTVGSPIVTNGVASNLSEYNYIQSKQKFDSTLSDSKKIIIKTSATITTTEGSYGSGILVLNKATGYLFELYRGDKYLTFYESRSYTSKQINFFSSDKLNKKIYYKITFTRNSSSDFVLELLYSYDDNTYESLYTKSYQTNILESYNDTVFKLGTLGASTDFNGTIDLNDFEVLNETTGSRIILNPFGNKTIISTDFNQTQMGAINSGATTTNIAQITTNQNAIGTLSSLTTTAKTNLVSAINEVNTNKVDANATITGATHTKITYDSKGLVTSGSDITLSDVTDVTATASEVNILSGLTASTTELNILDGITATTTELNYVDGVTSSIQSQLNDKANSASLATVATSGSYTDLSNKPTIGNATITFKKDGTTISGQSFTTNATSDIEINLGDTGKVDDVQINNTSIVSNKIANIPVAGNGSNGNLGVVKGNTSWGISVENSGYLRTVAASVAEIGDKTNQYKPIVPNTIDTAVKVGITTNTIPLLDSEKIAANTWLGSVQAVKVNGDTLVKDANNAVDIPAAALGSGSFGVVKLYNINYGLSVSDGGYLNVVGADNGQITNKTSGIMNPLLPKHIDLVTKVGLTTNTLILTSSEKETACAWLGAGQETIFVDWEG